MLIRHYLAFFSLAAINANVVTLDIIIISSFVLHIQGH